MLKDSGYADSVDYREGTRMESVSKSGALDPWDLGQYAIGKSRFYSH